MNFFARIKNCVPGAARLRGPRNSRRRSWLTIALCAALLAWAVAPIASSLISGQNVNAAPPPQARSSVGRTALGDIDENQLTVLRGNTVPMARPEFDRGLAPSTLPMDRMMLVLKRSPQQEAAFQKLIAEQQDHSSPIFTSG